MSRIQEVFGVRRVLLPVVHPVSEARAMASVRVAVEAGCLGVFVIDQGMSGDDVLRLIMKIRLEHPSLWVGVNLLDRPPAEVLGRGLNACDGRLDGIWSDNADINEHAPTQATASEFVRARERSYWDGLYFGGVAFKYQRRVASSLLRAAAEMSVPYMDVICTSGPGTGQAAYLKKVVVMRDGAGPSHSIALASGVTEYNVSDYLPHVDAFLVGTGIESELGVLDPGKTSRLMRVISDYSIASYE